MRKVTSLGPPMQVSTCRVGPILKGLQNWGKQDSNIWSILIPRPRSESLISIFNEEAYSLACKFPAYTAGSLLIGLEMYGKRASKKFGPFLPRGPWWKNLIETSSLYNTRTSMPRVSPASFYHVGQAPFSRGFILGQKAGQKFQVVLQYTSSTCSHGTPLFWTPSLLCNHRLPHDSPQYIVVSIALITCYCL